MPGAAVLVRASAATLTVLVLAAAVFAR